MVKAILIKPLDGDPEGTVREFDKPDFDRLVRYGAVRAVGGDLPMEDANTPDLGGEKSDPPVENKAAPKVANKAAPAVSNKSAD